MQTKQQGMETTPDTSADINYNRVQKPVRGPRPRSHEIQNRNLTCRHLALQDRGWTLRSFWDVPSFILFLECLRCIFFDFFYFSSVPDIFRAVLTKQEYFQRLKIKIKHYNFNARRLFTTSKNYYYRNEKTIGLQTLNNQICNIFSMVSPIFAGNLLESDSLTSYGRLKVFKMDLPRWGSCENKISWD